MSEFRDHGGGHTGLNAPRDIATGPNRNAPEPPPAEAGSGQEARVNRQADVWAWASLALWVVFFLVGLAPQRVFSTLRAWGGVTIYSAMVNSAQAISLALMLYLALLVHRLCRGIGLKSRPLLARTIFVAIVSYVAFMPVHRLPTSTLEFLILSWLVIGIKLVMWSYLLTLVVRHFALGDAYAFANILPLPPEFIRDQAPEPARTAPAPAVALKGMAEYGEYAKTREEPGS